MTGGPSSLWSRVRMPTARTPALATPPARAAGRGRSRAPGSRPRARPARLWLRSPARPGADRGRPPDRNRRRGRRRSAWHRRERQRARAGLPASRRCQGVWSQCCRWPRSVAPRRGVVPRVHAPGIAHGEAERQMRATAPRRSFRTGRICERPYGYEPRGRHASGRCGTPPRRSRLGNDARPARSAPRGSRS